jgi:iron only hydrogenase large subunit-like protein/uncharacterized Fe-S cluster-containing protein
MSYIRVRRTNCKNCFKCIKNCLVKCIRYKDDKIDIIDEGCILCGRCIKTCPRGAKRLDNDLSAVRNLLSSVGKSGKLCASLSSDFIAAYPKNAFKLITALRKLGFDIVEESSIGGALVTEEYRRIILASNGKNIISSACPTINFYIEKYYPELVPYLAPVMSPSEVHGKLLKEKYGSASKVIYIGACLSSIVRSNESPYLDGGITYQQLKLLLTDAGIVLDECDEGRFDEPSSYSRIYPTQGGITNDILNTFDKTVGTDKAGDYDLLSAGGLESAKKMLDELKSGSVSNVFAEIWACEGGCIGAPFMPANIGKYERRILVQDYADTADCTPPHVTADISVKHTPSPYTEDFPSEEEIKSILAQMGKYSKAQELDCGICGYPTCREKAAAVYHHKADIHMCLPYLLDINQSLSNTVLSFTPNMIIAVDSAMIIKEFNVAAQRTFKTARRTIIGKPLSELIDDSDFRMVIETKTSIFDKIVNYEDLGLVTEQSIIYSAEHDMAIATIKDITYEQIQRKKAYEKKIKSLELAQNVIDKQMFVAQQIAGLLGETTAETKVALSKLKELITAEEGNRNG